MHLSEQSPLPALQVYPAETVVHQPSQLEVWDTSAGCVLWQVGFALRISVWLRSCLRSDIGKVPLDYNREVPCASMAVGWAVHFLGFLLYLLVRQCPIRSRWAGLWICISSSLAPSNRLHSEYPSVAGGKKPTVSHHVPWPDGAVGLALHMGRAAGWALVCAIVSRAVGSPTQLPRCHG